MVVDGIEIVRERPVAVSLVRTGVKHHAALGRDEFRHAAHLPRRLVDDGRGKILEPNRLSGDLPLGDLAARRDGKQRRKRRRGLAVRIVDLRLESDTRSCGLHCLAPYGKRLATFAAIAGRMHPLVAEPMRSAARPSADDQLLAERRNRALPRLDRHGNLPPPVVRHAICLAPLADAVKPVIVPQADDNTCNGSFRYLANSLRKEIGCRRIARTERPLLP